MFELIRAELAASPMKTYVEIAAGLGTTPGTVIQVAKLHGLSRHPMPPGLRRAAGRCRLLLLDQAQKDACPEFQRPLGPEAEGQGREPVGEGPKQESEEPSPPTQEE